VQQLALLGVGSPAVALADAPPGAAACLTCHAPGPASAGVMAAPLLAGQQEEYLVKQLRNFRDGERGLAPALRADHDVASGPLRALAAHFAAQPPVSAGPELADDAGRQLYLNGDARRNVPACAGCHGARPQDVASPTTPILHGQPAPYLAYQLRQWRAGLRDNSVDGLMNRVVERLDDADIGAVSGFLAGARPR
jgi:cytochrome c553